MKQRPPRWAVWDLTTHQHAQRRAGRRETGVWRLTPPEARPCDPCSAPLARSQKSHPGGLCLREPRARSPT